MDNESVLPKLKYCPVCRSSLKSIIYGMLAEPPAHDEIAAGCLMDSNSPTKACSSCDWQGGIGGRTWAVQLQDFEGNDCDLTEMSDEEVFEFGKYRLEGRYELVFRGREPRDVDFEYDQFDETEAASLPLITVEITLAYYNSATQLIEQVCYFNARGRQHLFSYLRPGLEAWDSAFESVQAFHEVVFSMKKPDVTGWILNLPEQVHSEDLDAEPENWGSPVIKAMIANTPMAEDELRKNATQLDRTVYWPYWFEPAFYVSMWGK